MRGVNSETGLGIIAVNQISQNGGSMRLLNISTRGHVGTGEEDMRAGFVIEGQPGSVTRFILKAEGPILNMPGVLNDPELIVTKLEANSSGTALIEKEVASNDNWRDDPLSQDVSNFAPPASNREAALSVDLAPGTYIATMRGVNGTSGLGILAVNQIAIPGQIIDNGDARAHIEKWLQDTSRWTDEYPTKATQDAPTGDKIDLQPEAADGGVYQCTNTPYSITSTPEAIVTYSPNASVFWLGNLIQGNSVAGGLGTMQELSIRERGPLRVYIDFLRQGNTKTVQVPSLTSVQSAIGELVQEAQKDPDFDPSSDATYTSIEAHSVEQAALKLGMSAKYLGASAKAKLSFSKSVEKRTLMVHFVQKLYTAAIELPAFPGDMFNSAMTKDKWDRYTAQYGLTSANPPLYIANIAYGRILTYSFTSTATKERIKAAIDWSYRGIASGYAAADLRKTVSEAEINIVALGGSDAAIRGLIQEGNLDAYFREETALTQVRPISYQLNALKDNSLIQVSETTNYTIQQCEFNETPDEPWKFTVEMYDVEDVMVTRLNGGGSDGKIKWTHTGGNKTKTASLSNFVRKGDNTVTVQLYHRNNRCGDWKGKFKIYRQRGNGTRKQMKSRSGSGFRGWPGSGCNAASAGSTALLKTWSFKVNTESGAVINQ